MSTENRSPDGPNARLGRPAVSLLHQDPPPTPQDFFFHRRWVFLTASVVALTLAALASWDRGRILLEVDRPVTQWIVDHRTPLLTDLFDAASRLGDNVVVFTVAAVLALLTFRRCRYLALALVAAALVRPVLEFFIKAFVGRVRPDIEPLVDFQGPSHPSGHPLAAASLWGLVPAVVALHFRSRVLWWSSIVVAVVVVVMVAASRVYRGAHYLLDVTASLAWAALYLAAVQGVFDRYHREADCAHPQHETQTTGT